MRSKRLILALVDGLTPEAFEAAAEDPQTPTFRLLAEHGTYRRAASVFPSLTPVCVSSIVTGAQPDRHHIPHLVWYHREERRLVEYGSSFAAVRRAGTRRTFQDAVFRMNDEHLSRETPTLFESLEDAGLVTAAVNIPCYRGGTRHRPKVPGLARPAFGPKRFFFYSLFESDETGAPLAFRNRAAGTVDDYASAVGRWLVTRDGFDFLAYYLSDYDYLSHASGPTQAREGLLRVERALAALVEAAGGLDELLARYAVILCSDHGQTPVDRIARLQEPLRTTPAVLVTASNRAGMVYRLTDAAPEPAELAAQLDRADGVDVVAYLDDDAPVVRRRGELLSLHDAALADVPQASIRITASLRNPNAGELLVSASPGYEFADLGGRHHLGGGSHGSLLRGDSEVPVLLVGLDGEPDSIADLAGLVRSELEVDAPAPLHA